MLRRRPRRRPSGRRSRRRGAARAGLAALLALGLALPPAASTAQGLAGHPVADRPRPLRERLERAEIVAVVRVDTVEAGRLRVRRERVLRGDPPARFELKRSPKRPPPLAEGDRALLLLRGARPPYVLVDRPDETIRLPDEAAVERWVPAVRAVLEHEGEPEILARHYGDWIDEGPETLRQLGFRGLVESASRRPEAVAAIARERARAAADPALPEAARRRSAALAIRTAEGTDALLSALAERPDAADPALVAAAVGAAERRGRPELERALRALLAHPEAEVRRAALRGLGSSSGRLGEPERELVGRAAREDPSEAVRERARRLLRGARAPARAAGATGEER